MEVTLKIFRFDPGVDAVPYYQTYALSWSEGVTLLAAIRRIYAEQDASLAFRNYFCGRGLCAGCRLTVDGEVKKACHVLLQPGREYRVEPLKDHSVIRDLVVDFGLRRSAGDKSYDIRQGACF